jgi:hypothetical protein
MDWLRREVVEGLQALVALRLRGAPAADMVVLTAEIWEQAFEQRLGRHAIEAVDAPRIREAFRFQFPRLREWPAPADILESMPPRPPRPALPEPKVTEEQHRENVKRVKAMVGELLGGWAKKGGVNNG